MGLEVHAELSTKTKIFCGCTTDFGGEPNTHVCPVCSGMPGVLPKLNLEVVEYAIKLGLALGCSITQNCKFDRKNYFYPDLPKAYQVSQLYAPICHDGSMNIKAGDKDKTIRIREIHMEEDAGKLVHAYGNSGTFVDFNRCGVPLLEIVSQPDFRSADEVLSYFEQLRETLLYLKICDCKMEEGSLRADVNISVRLTGGQMGVRTELKNLNSTKAIGNAIEYEAARHIRILEGGGQVVQETRRWDDERGESCSMRSKENAQDYRYFPEPDLLPIHIDDAWIKRIKETLPELTNQKRERYMRDYGLSLYAAKVLTDHMSIAHLFESVAEKSKEPKEAANLIIGEVMHLMNNTNTLPEDVSIDAQKLTYLISLVKEGKINRNAYKKAVEAVFMSNVDPQSYIIEKGLFMVSDDETVSQAVDIVLAENPDAVSDYHSGKDKAFGFLMGQVMKKLGRAGNPEAVRMKLTKKIKE